MWRSKKFIIIALLVVLVVGGTLGGVAIAQADDQSSSANQTAVSTLMSKVAEIYEQNTNVAINADELQKAFVEAGKELRKDARDTFIDKLATDGKITQEQADDLKAWLDEMPTLPTDEFKQWMQSRPDIPGLFGQSDRLRIGPFGGMHRDFGRFWGGFGGKFGQCPPAAPSD